MMNRPVALVCMVLMAACSASSPPTVQRVNATPVPTPTPEPTAPPTLEPTPPPTPAATPRPPRTRAAVRATAPPPPAPAVADLSSFNGLGGWIDVYDHTNDPATIVPKVRDMASRGVRTLYLESARYDDTNPIRYPRAVGAAIEEAHARGLRVVGWYPPNFADVEADLRRSIGAIRFVTPGGHRFDAFAPDIEYTQAVPDHAERNRRALDYSQRLRAEAGSVYPLAAITYPPSSLRIRPELWRDFPWTALAGLYQVFMPMNYWTGRGTDAETASAYTTENTAETRRLTGKPVHIIGGLADRIDEPQANAYVDAALANGAIGGGLYDYQITRPEVWDELARLNL